MSALANDEIIRRIDAYQQNPRVHPLTCMPSQGHALRHVLRPKIRGGVVVLTCPECNYVQTSIPEFVLRIGGGEMAEVPILTLEEFRTKYPDARRPETDLGYDAGMPWYLRGGTHPFYDAWNWNAVVGYVCSKCGGVREGLPGDVRRHLFESRVACVVCGWIIYETALYSS